MKWPCGGQTRTGNVSDVIPHILLHKCLWTERQRNGTAQLALILKSSTLPTFWQKSSLRLFRFTVSVAMRSLSLNSKVNSKVTNRPSSVSDANEKASSWPVEILRRTGSTLFFRNVVFPILEHFFCHILVITFFAQFHLLRIWAMIQMRERFESTCTADSR